MGNTTFSGPVRIGPRLNTSTLGNNNVGTAVTTQVGVFTFDDLGAAFSLGVNIPANSRILNITGYAESAFTGATNVDLEIGTSTDADAFADITDFHSGGVRVTTVDNAQATAWSVSADTEVFATPAVTGTATAGSGFVVVEYIQLPTPA